MQDLIISLHLHCQSLLEFEFPWSQFNNFLLPWVVALRQRTNSSLPIVSNCNFQHEWMSPLTKYRMRLQHGCRNDLWTQTLPALTKSTICIFLKKQSHAKISLSLWALPKIFLPVSLFKSRSLSISCVFCPSDNSNWRNVIQVQPMHIFGPSISWDIWKLILEMNCKKCIVK